MGSALLLRNRSAFFNYTIFDKYVVGISLLGSEVKSIRESKISLKDAFCILQSREIYVLNLRIERYASASYLNHDPLRKKKLLLRKEQIIKIEKKMRGTRRTLTVLKMFTPSSSNFIKLEIAIAEGRKIYDKREDIKIRDAQRSVKSHYQ